MKLNCTEIVTNLYLADLHAITHEQLCRHVTMFVSVCKENVEKYDIFLKELQGQLLVVKSMRAECDDMLAMIHNQLLKYEGVVLFCETARSRSPSLAAAYLVKYAGLSASDAISGIRSKSSNAFPEECVYMSLLQDLEKRYTR